MTLAVNAIVLTPPAARGSGGPRPAPAAGDLLRLALEGTAGDDPVFKSADGLILRLPGLLRIARQLAPGDSLLFRVQATTPQLVLSMAQELQSGSPAAAGSSLPPAITAEPSAMQADQLAMRQISWGKPDTDWMASSWRSQVLQQSRQQAYAAGDMPLPLLAAGDAKTGVLSATGNERWQFPLFGWGGATVLLRLADAQEEQRQGRPRRAAPPVLRLECMFPELGRVVLQLQLINGGISLVLAVEQDSSLPGVRAAAPAIAEALAAAGLRLHRFRVERGIPHAHPPTGWPGLPQAAQAVSPLLFRAGAEALVVLARGCYEPGRGRAAPGTG